MPMHLAASAALAALILVQAPGSDEPTEAVILAGIYGRTLGAASQCKAVSRERIDALAERASARVKRLAKGMADAAAAGDRMADGIRRGSGEVTSGATTCTQAESDFANLEQELTMPETRP